jgi:hypothetical protein
MGFGLASGVNGLTGGKQVGRLTHARPESTSRRHVGRIALKVESVFPVAAPGPTGRLVIDLKSWLCVLAMAKWKKSRCDKDEERGNYSKNKKIRTCSRIRVSQQHVRLDELDLERRNTWSQNSVWLGHVRYGTHLNRIGKSSNVGRQTLWTQ